ncbi:MAG: hypothetical protein H0X37_15045 [Herpetosiphonaceae bacterium]|nr:hypothetical protein [Herpetosiphonaceae bacterium]
MKRQFMMGIVALTLVLISAQPAGSQARAATDPSAGKAGRLIDRSPFAGSQARAATDPSGAIVAAPQGFGDRQNSTPWAMTWWKGQLYVGTDRAMACVQDATQVYYKLPGAVYPDPDPDIYCTPSPDDLPLQAEIWRWTPGPNTWERVFQSPNDVPIPNAPGKFVARDVGFRTITAFTEADGTEALYIGGLSSRSFHGKKMPPPRILRSTDGQTWNPIPQDSGTFLGNTFAVGFRSLTVYNGQMYVVASNGLTGQGPVYVASNPAGGDNNFRQITPVGMPSIYEMASFNGFLYLGQGDVTPFTVWKMTNTKPYTFTPVISNGAYQNPADTTVVSMQVFNNMLYIGTAGVADVYRIHTNDSWDLVVGNSRTNPSNSQLLTSVSGLGDGFNWSWNKHIWRMSVYNNQLYVGTFDTSTQFRNDPGNPYQQPSFQAQLGFDLYSTADGVHYLPVTTTGFGDKFSFGVRNIVATPNGLFIGGANPYYGLQIWQIPAGGTQ